MRANIDDRLMAEALAATGARTKREAVGLEALLCLRRQQDARDLRGGAPWQGDLDATRRDV